MLQAYKAWKARKEYERCQYELACRTLREASNLVTDDEPGWTSVAQQNKSLTDSDQGTMPVIHSQRMHPNA